MKKGFTLIEIITTVIIIGIIAAIVIPGVSKLMKNFREEYYIKLEKINLKTLTFNYF